MAYVETQPGPNFERESDIQDWHEHLEGDGEVDVILKSCPVRHVPCLRHSEKVEFPCLANLRETAKDILGVQFTANECASDVDVSLTVLREESGVDFVGFSQVVGIHESVMELKC